MEAPATAHPPDVRRLVDRLGRVASQPVSVHSFTNKRLTVNYRVSRERLQHLLPDPIEAEELPGTDEGLLSMCACDFAVTRLGGLPVPRVHTNEMLCRISVRVPWRGAHRRAYYTLRSDSSSRLLGFLGGRFSHYRKATSAFSRVDDGDVYELRCTPTDPLCGGRLRASLTSLSKHPPATSRFRDVEEATDFVLELDGSCGFDYASSRLSFQRIEYPPWDASFCHEVDFRFPLLEHLFAAYDLEPRLDSTLFVRSVRQVWRSAWLGAPG